MKTSFDMFGFDACRPATRSKTRPMSEPHPGTRWPPGARRLHARAPTVKRFYKTADVGEADGGFALLLDGRRRRTPAKAKLIVPTRALAEAIAARMGGAGRDHRIRRPCR